MHSSAAQTSRADFWPHATPRHRDPVWCRGRIDLTGTRL